VRTIHAATRSVARSGSAPRSGRGGRRFKSCHSGQHLADSRLRTVTGCVTDTPPERATHRNPGFGYSAGVTGRPFSNEINGTLDKIPTITCDKSAKSLRSDQTNTSHQCLARERRESYSPQPARAHQISSFGYGPGWFAFSSGPRPPKTEGAAGRRGPVLAAAITCPKAGSRTPAQSAMLADPSTNPMRHTRIAARQPAALSWAAVPTVSCR
jgi:hypothetical protein